MTQAGTNENFDAQRMVEEIQTGEQEAPNVNVDADYERSKQYEVAEIDRTNEGMKAAEKATASQVDSSRLNQQFNTDSDRQESVSDADPDDYREMAKEVNPRLQ